jgi:hypothetical protein
VLAVAFTIDATMQLARVLGGIAHRPALVS